MAGLDLEFRIDEHLAARARNDLSNTSPSSMLGEKDDGLDRQVFVTPLEEIKQLAQQIWAKSANMLLVLIAMFFAASMDMAVRLLEMPGNDNSSGSVSTLQILLFRQIITSIGITVYAVVNSDEAKHLVLGEAKIFGLLLVRGASGFVAVFGIYFSLPALTLTEATVLTFMAPIITCYASTYLLKNETFTSLQQLASAVSIAGVVIIALASNENTSGTAHGIAATQHLSISRHLGIFVGLLGVFGQAGGMITTRRIGPRAHPLTIIHYSSLASIIFCGSMLFTMSYMSLTYMSLKQWMLLLFATCCGFLFQFFLTIGLQQGTSMQINPTVERPQSTADEQSVPFLAEQSSERPQERAQDVELATKLLEETRVRTSMNRAVCMMYTQAIFALFYDWGIWRNLPTLSSWFGILMIVSGAVWIATTK